MLTASRGSRILILDGRVGSLVAIRHALALRSHRCAPAATLVEAVARAASFQPNVVMYEWQLRRESRSRLVAWLQVIARTCRMVATSTLDEPAGFRDDYVVHDYFTKPIDVEGLQRALHQEGGTTANVREG